MTLTSPTIPSTSPVVTRSLSLSRSQKLFAGFRRKSSTTSLEIVHETYNQSQARNPNRKQIPAAALQLPSPQSMMSFSVWPIDTDVDPSINSTPRSADDANAYEQYSSPPLLSPAATLPRSTSLSRNNRLSEESFTVSALSMDRSLSFVSDEDEVANVLSSPNASESSRLSDGQSYPETMVRSSHEPETSKKSMFTRLKNIRLPKLPRRNSRKNSIPKSEIVISAPMPDSFSDSEEHGSSSRKYTYSQVMEDFLFAPSDMASNDRNNITHMIYDDQEDLLMGLEPVQEEDSSEDGKEQQPDQQQKQQEPSPPTSPSHILSPFRDSNRLPCVTFDDLLDRIDDEYGVRSRRPSQSSCFSSSSSTFQYNPSIAGYSEKSLDHYDMEKPTPIYSFPVELSPLSGQEDTIGRRPRDLPVPSLSRSSSSSTTMSKASNSLAPPARPPKSKRRILSDKPTIKPPKLQSFKIDMCAPQILPSASGCTDTGLSRDTDDLPPVSTESWRSEFENLVRLSIDDKEYDDGNDDGYYLARPEPKHASRGSSILEEACAIADEYRKSQSYAAEDDWRSVYSSIYRRSTDIVSPGDEEDSVHIRSETPLLISPVDSTTVSPKPHLSKLMPLSTFSRSLRSAISSAILAEDDSFQGLVRDLNAFLSKTPPPSPENLVPPETTPSHLIQV